MTITLQDFERVGVQAFRLKTTVWIHALDRPGFEALSRIRSKHNE